MTPLGRRLLAAIVFALGSVLVSAAAVTAQTPAVGELHGTVTDPDGFVVVGLDIALQDARGRTWTTTTSGRGTYRFEKLPPGSYTLIATAKGFRDFTAHVEVGSGQSVQFDPRLTIGFSVSVEVKEPPKPSLDTRKSLSSLILTGEDIAQLPDDPALLMQALLAMAGATRPGDVAVVVDGLADYKHFPKKAAIEMIRVESNPFSPEFSHPGTKRIEITTKPGADGFHGDTRFQYRDSRTDSKNPLETTKPLTEYRNVNGYFQGPVVKDRIGFLAYGGHWDQDDTAIVHAWVLDPAASLAQPFNRTVPTPTRVTTSLFKTDLAVRHQLFNLSYTRTDQDQHNQGLESGYDLPERGYDRRSKDQTGELWWTAIARHAVNDLRLEATDSRASASPFSAAPAVVVLDAFSAGGNQDASYQTTTRTIDASEALTLRAGKHTWKAGVQYEQMNQASVNRSGFGGTFTFGSDVERDQAGHAVLDAAGQPIPISPLENYRRTLLGLSGYGPSQFLITTGDPRLDVSQWNAGWFVLDDWSIADKFSISYGVRQDLQNNIARRLDLAPRVDLSWVLDNRGKNSIKGGAGVFYDRVDPSVTLETRKLDGSSRLRQLVVQNPTFFPVVPTTGASVDPVQTVTYTKAADLRAPRSVQASVTYQRMLPAGFFAVVTYEFSRGQYLLRSRSLTAPPTSPGATAVPLHFQFESTGRSLSHAVTLGLSGSIGPKLTLYADYTYSRKYNDTDGPFAMPADSNNVSIEYGPASDDHRHEVVAGASAQIPGGIYLTPSVAFTSGVPFNILTGRDNNGDTIFNDRPSFARPGDAGAIATPYGLLNPNPAPGETIVPRNFGREPSQLTVNLAVSKNLFGGATISIDAENLLDARRLVGSIGVLTSPDFGMPNRALNGRRLEFTVRNSF
jgi:hypothetical protein